MMIVSFSQGTPTLFIKYKISSIQSTDLYSHFTRKITENMNILSISREKVSYNLKTNVYSPRAVNCLNWRFQWDFQQFFSYTMFKACKMLFFYTAQLKCCLIKQTDTLQTTKVVKYQSFKPFRGHKSPIFYTFSWLSVFCYHFQRMTAVKWPYSLACHLRSINLQNK